MARPKKHPDLVPGVELTMPGLPGPAESIDTEAPLEPVIQAPYDGAPLDETIIGPIGPGESASAVATGDAASFTPMKSVGRLRVIGMPDPGEVAMATAIAATAGLPLQTFPYSPLLNGPARSVVPSIRRYRVWPHGELHHDGVVYGPGAELTLPPAIGDAIECLKPVE